MDEHEMTAPITADERARWRRDTHHSYPIDKADSLRLLDAVEALAEMKRAHLATLHRERTEAGEATYQDAKTRAFALVESAK